MSSIHKPHDLSDYVDCLLSWHVNAEVVHEARLQHVVGFQTAAPNSIPG